MNHPGIFPSCALWRGSSRSGTRCAGQLHFQIAYWERWFYSSEEKTPICLSHNDRNNQRKLDRYWIHVCVFVYIYIYMHTSPYIFIYVYVQPIFLIHIQTPPIFLCICTHINKTEGTYIKQKFKWPNIFVRANRK